MLLRRSQFRLAQIEHRLEVLGGLLVAYLNLDKVIKIIRNEDEPKPVLMTDLQALGRAGGRHPQHAAAQPAQARGAGDQQEDKDLRAERKTLKELIGSEKGAMEEGRRRNQGGAREVRAEDAARQAPHRISPRRPEHDEAAIEEALVEREPITVVVSEKGWIRALRGTVSDLSGVAFKIGRSLKFAFPAETTSRCLVFATNGRFYTLDASKLPGGRGHGEPVRLFVDLEQEADLVVACFDTRAGASSWWRAGKGAALSIAEDECLANTRKGKQVLNVSRRMRRAQSRWSRASSSRRSARTARW